MFFFKKKETTNYGKIIAVTLACVAGACAVACLVYVLFQKFFGFCECDACDCCCDEEELLEEDCEDCEVCIEEPEAVVADAE